MSDEIVVTIQNNQAPGVAIFEHLPLPNLITYTAQSLTVTTGLVNSGNLASIQTLGDGNTLSIQEQSGVPGYDIRIGFTNVINFTQILVNFIYNGGAGHMAGIDIFNYTSSAWDTVYNFTDMGTTTQRVIEIIDSGKYISSGAAQARFYHTSSGNVAHSIVIDYVALRGN